jgi:hypothetical protein
VYGGSFQVQSTTTVKYRAFDNAGNAESVNSQLITVTVANPDTTPPTSTIACNSSACQSSAYSAAVTVSISATDNAGGSGVSQIRYTTDGSAPTATTGTVYTGTFSVASTITVKYLAFDNAGNVEAVNSQLITVTVANSDTTAPTSTITCNGGICSSGWYPASVTIGLSATDNPGGSGVSQIRYTTDGSDPTATTGTVYTGAVNVAVTTMVKYRAFDNAGNAEAVKSQLIQVDTAAPKASIACNGGTCATWYKAPVSVSLSATDTGGSGVAQIRYTLDGSTPTATTGTVYTGPFTVSSATTTVTYRAFDGAGNASTSAKQTIQIDSTAPTVRITSPATGASVTGSVSLKADAADVGGSGVLSVAFYVDGKLIGTDSSGHTPYSINWNTKGVTKGTHTITAVATDRAGNQTTSVAVTVTVT